MNAAELERVVQTTRFRVLLTASPDSCIASCRALRDTLRWLGVSTRPLQVSAITGNRAWLEQTLAGKPMEEPAHSVGLGVPRPGTAEGHRHLVLLSEDRLFDPSLDQARREPHGILAEPLVLEVSPEERKSLLTGTGSVGAALDGWAVLYHGWPKEKWYTTSPNWGKRDRGVNEQMVREIIRALREQGIGA